MFLLGAASAAIPFILHLLYRKRAPRIPFSTVRFLLASVRKTAHRRRIHQLLLLLLRAGALFLLALGLAGPFIPSLGLGGGADAAVAVILDNSCSMAAVVEGVPRYAVAKQMAEETARGLGRGTSVALFFTNGQPAAAREKSVAGTLSVNREQVLAEIIASETSAAQGNVTNAILQAEALLREAKTADRSIYVFTDFQQNAWADISSKGAAGSAGMPIIVVDCGAGGYRNLAVTRVEVRGKGRATGVPISIEATVHNVSSQPQRSVPVSLWVGSQQREVRAVDIPANATASVSFTTSFSAAGTRTGSIMIAIQDSLSLDNRRYFAVDLAEQLQVLLVKSRSGSLRVLDPAFYLICALDPSQTGVADVHSVIKPKEILLDQLADANLQGIPVVMLLEPGKLSETSARALGEYVADGGHLVLFPGGGLDAAFWNSLRTADDRPLLPVTFTPKPESVESRDQAVSLADLDFTHPLLAGFRTLPQAAFEEIRVHQWRGMQPRPGQGDVLIRLANRRPFLVEGPAGAGKVLVFATPATAEWGNFPVRRLFLPLMHEVVYYLAGRTEQVLSFLPGVPVQLPVPEDVAEVELSFASRRVRARRDALQRWTHAPGVYRWQAAGESSLTGAFVINAPPEESDLTRVEPEKALAMLGERRSFLAEDIDAVRRIRAELGSETQLRNYIIFLVLGIALLECFLSNFTGQRAIPGRERAHSRESAPVAGESPA